MVTLIILDGFGESEKIEGNAIKLAGTPNLSKLKSIFPHTLINASGEYVGLPKGQIGNSEVGHLTLGGGRIIKQDLMLINELIENKVFFNNEQLNKACDFVKETDGALHLVGLISDGGIHSHINHLKAIIDLTVKKELKKVYLHCITDGRDTEIDEGLKFVQYIKKYCHETNVKIASVAGRIYGMDREQRWTDKTMLYYDMLVLGKAYRYVPENDVETIFKESYKNKEFDEFIKPSIVGSPKTINNGDAVIFFNFRPDRMRQITEAICEKDFDKFPRKNLNFNYFVSMCEYNENFKNVHVAIREEKLKNTLTEVISNNNLKQFHIAETTKYAHVTYYFNGGIEKPFKNEIRKLIPSHKDPDFTHNPQMKAIEITTEVVDAVSSGEYDFIIVNFSNPDMLGHTANIEATKKAITIVDKCAYAVAMSVLMAGGDCIITADHGNAEKLINENGQPCTTHTANPVEFILITKETLNQELNNGEVNNSNLEKKSETDNENLINCNNNSINIKTSNINNKNNKNNNKENKISNNKLGFILKEGGTLANVAPTILELLKLEKPKEMTESSLIKYNPRKN